MLAVVVPAPVFPVQRVIITDVFDAFIFNFASTGSDSYNVTKLLGCLQLVGSSDHLFITTLLSKPIKMMSKTTKVRPKLLETGIIL